jgi:hypothetical protein
MSRLVLDLSSEQHQIIKALAATEGKSMKDFMLARILPETDDGEACAWDELKEILAARLQSATQKGTSTTSISDLTEETLRALPQG